MSLEYKSDKYCNCKVSSNKLILKSSVNYSYCENCGSILIKTSSGNIYYTVKPKQKIKPVEFSPIEIIRTMKKKTEEEYPFLNNEYNLTEIEKYNKEKLLKSIDLYSKYRKMIILNLQKMMKMLDFSDLIFYQCLFYIDTYLSHKMDEDMDEKKVLYYLVGYFLCSCKFKETDIYEPTLDSFCSLKKKIYLSTEKISYYEVLCLKSIKYNVFSYSVYDWLSELITIGFVFDCEIDKNNTIILINGHRHSIINTISKYAIKLLLNITVKTIFFKYSPMYLAFSLMKISREKYLDKNLINNKLFNKLTNIYGVNYMEYKRCYKELKVEIEEKYDDDIHENENLKIEENGESVKKNNFDLAKLKVDSTEHLLNKNDQIIIDKKANKMKSSAAVLYLKDPSDTILEQEKEENKNDKSPNKEDNNNTNNNTNKFNVENDNDNDNVDSINENSDSINDNSDNVKENNNNENENIILYNEQNKEKNNDNINNNMDLDFDINININIKENKIKNKLSSSHELNHIKVQSKNHVFINCKNSKFNTNENLPKVLMNQSTLNQTNINETKDTSVISSLKFSSSKIVNNKFLKPSLNPIKIKKNSNSIDSRRYFQSSFSNSSNKNNNLMSKKELESMCKSLFYENSNQKKFNNAIPLSVSLNKMKSSNAIPQLENFKNLIKNDKFENNENDSKRKEKKKRVACKSKGKSINNLAGKETKIYKPNKRNVSTNHFKRKNVKNFLDANNDKSKGK